MSGRLQPPVRGKPTACGERLPLGAANDDDGSRRLAVEVRAAAMDHGDSGLWTDDEVRGWDMHGVDDDASPGNDGEECGYLARELATHDDRDDRDADAWPWSIARPIAEQQPVLIEIVVASEPDGADTDGSLPPGAEPADTCDDHDASAAQPGEAHATRTEGRLENGGAP